MDLRHNLEDGGSEDGTGKEAHGKPTISQDSNTKVPRRLKGGQDMQGEENGGGDRLIITK